MAHKTEMVHEAPPSETKEIEELYRLFLLNRAPALVGPDHQSVPIPESVYNVLLKVIAYMTEGKGVSILPVMKELTTQEAANLLGLSRPFLIKLLDRGELPFHRTGAHRRLYLGDVLNYRRQRDASRKEILGALAKRAVDQGQYEQIYVPDDRE